MLGPSGGEIYVSRIPRLWYPKPNWRSIPAELLQFPPMFSCDPILIRPTCIYYTVYTMPDTDTALPVILPVRLEPQLAQELDAVREGRNMSRSAFVVEAVKAALLAQADLKFRVAELALREFLVFVAGAKDGGVFDRETARSLDSVLQRARASMAQRLEDHERLRRGPRKWDPHSPHGLALAETEPLRKFVDRFSALCSQEDQRNRPVQARRKKSRK